MNAVWNWIVEVCFGGSTGAAQSVCLLAGMFLLLGAGWTLHALARPAQAEHERLGNHVDYRQGRRIQPHTPAVAYDQAEFELYQRIEAKARAQARRERIH